MNMKLTAQVTEAAHKMAISGSKKELEALKKEYSEDIVKLAWAALDSSIKERLKAICEKPKDTRPKLWELSEEVLRLEEEIALVEEDEDLNDSEKEQRVEALILRYLQAEGDFNQKSLAIASYIKHQETLSEARKAEYRRLRALSEQAEKSAERLRGYLLKEMERLGKTKVEGATGKVSLRRKPKRVILNCEPEDLPPQFVEVEYKPKLREIKAHLVTREVDWAAMSEVDEFCLLIK
jgi:hypothetical protein